MKSQYSHPGVEVGDEVAILRIERMLHGRVVETNKMKGDCVIAVGDTTPEGHLTIANTMAIPWSKLSPLGVGRWIILEQ
jgi:hypothetical protein